MAVKQDEKAERITKVKVKKGEWTICWQKKSEATGTYDIYEVTSKDMPLEELPKRLQVMANHVTEICDLPQGATKNIVVSGITESYTDENRYLVITAIRELSKSKSPMLINTPARPLYPEGDQDETFCMSKECFEDLLAVEIEAMKYVRGERAQQSLDFGGEDNSGAADGAEETPKKPRQKKRSAAGGGMGGGGGIVAPFPMAAKGRD